MVRNDVKEFLNDFWRPAIVPLPWVLAPECVFDSVCVYRWVRPAGAGHAAVFDLGLTHTNTVTYEYRKAEDRHVLGRHLNL